MPQQLETNPKWRAKGKGSGKIFETYKGGAFPPPISAEREAEIRAATGNQSVSKQEREKERRVKDGKAAQGRIEHLRNWNVEQKARTPVELVPRAEARPPVKLVPRQAQSGPFDAHRMDHEDYDKETVSYKHLTLPKNRQT